MNSLQKRIGAAAGVVIVAGVAVYWYCAPYLAMRQLRNAAVAADAETFNKHVDFPKLRDSLKSQFSARLDKDIAKQPASANEFARAGNAFGGLLARTLVDKLIDTAVRPETIMFAMREGKFRVELNGRREGEPNTEQQTGQETGQQTAGRKHVVWSTERKGLDTVLFHIEDEGNGSGKDKMALVMQREGFADWKLTGVRLPD